MNTSRNWSKWLTICSTVVAIPVASAQWQQGVDQGVYFRGGIGPEVSQKTDLTEYFGAVSGVEVKYDPGFRLSLAGGYQFCRYFGAELETGVIYNSIKSITGSSNIDASLANVPLLANAVFQFPVDDHFVPYFGFGGGASTSVLDIRHVTLFNGDRLRGDDSDVVWAAQAFAGFRYEINDRMAVGFAYKFLATGEPSWDVYSFNTSSSGQLQLDNARTHSFLAEFRMSF